MRRKLVIVSTFGLVIFVFVSAHFLCGADYDPSRYYPSEQNYKEYGSFFSSLAYLRFRYILYCVWRGIDRHHDAIVATSTIGILIVTTGLAYFTYWLWDATRKLVEGAETTAETQLRAYVFIKKHEPVLIRNGDERFMRFSPIWENTGSTPTKKASGHAAYKYFKDGDIPDDFDFPETGVGETSLTVIGPHQCVEIVEVNVPFGYLSDIFQKQGNVYIWGSVEYNDVFEATPRHRTEFCYRLRVLANPLTNLNPFIGVAVHKKHNGADDECYRQPRQHPQS